MRLLFKTVFFLSLSHLAFAQTTLDEALKHWQKRDQKTELTAAISKLEKFIESNPKNLEALLYLTRAHFLMADAHLTSKDDKLKHFEIAYKTGEKALLQNETYKMRVEKKEEPHFAAKAFTKEEVPQLYWTAASLGRFAKTNGVMSSLKHKSTIVAFIQRVEELDPKYFYGAVPRYWGSYYAALPGIMGGSLKKSKNYFEESLKIAPGYVGTKVLRAETYLVGKEDKKEFKEVLNSVISDTTHDNHPEIGAENRLEKQKAKALLNSMDELF